MRQASLFSREQTRAAICCSRSSGVAGPTGAAALAAPIGAGTGALAELTAPSFSCWQKTQASHGLSSWMPYKADFQMPCQLMLQKNQRVPHSFADIPCLSLRPLRHRMDCEPLTSVCQHGFMMIEQLQCSFCWQYAFVSQAL